MRAASLLNQAAAHEPIGEPDRSSFAQAPIKPRARDDHVTFTRVLGIHLRSGSHGFAAETSAQSSGEPGPV